MAFMEISVVPIGTGTTSLSKHVAAILKVIEESGLPFQLHDMGTTVEGKAEELLGLAARAHEAAFENEEVKRVYTVIKLDDRRDKITKMGDKTSSVKEKL